MHGIMFHHFHDDQNHKKIRGSLTKEDLEKMIDYMGPEQILDPIDFLERYRQTPSAPYYCLTFDDTLKSQIDIALPVLESRNIKAFWFTYSSVLNGIHEKIEVYRYFSNRYFDNFEVFYQKFFAKAAQLIGADRVKHLEGIDYASHFLEAPYYTLGDRKYRYWRAHVLSDLELASVFESMIEEKGISVSRDIAPNLWMVPGDITELADRGHAIGLHSFSHPMALGKESYAVQSEEYQRNHKDLTGLLNRGSIWSASYPTGSFSQDTFRVMQDCRIEIAFRSTLRPPFDHLLEVPREDHTNIMTQIRELTAIGHPYHRVYQPVVAF